MNTELMEALTILEKEKKYQQRCDDGCNRKLTDQCM